MQRFFWRVSKICLCKKSENWRQKKKKLFDKFVGWNSFLNDLQYWINFFTKTKNAYWELFLCKSINQTAFLIVLLRFSSAPFIRWTNCLIAFLLAPGHSRRHFKHILFFSLVQLLMQTVSQIVFPKLWF